MSADEASVVVDLAREAGFALGGLEARPSTRELIVDGRPEVLEPRVMQVLVALARQRGRVVSRYELVASCWGGRAVSEDAIGRCIAAIRRLSEAHGGFTLTTVARVGYRLDAASTEPGEPAPPMLAVLAFDNLSGDPDMAWFSDGVSEEIQQTVARGADLRVIGRASSFQFRGADKAAGHVAAALKATHVLDGSVRRHGDKVRISAQLIECGQQTTLWSDRFDGDLADVFALQDEIAAAVAAALQTTFARTSPVGKIDPVAFELYLKARSQSGEAPASLPDNIGRLERAVSLAPQLGPAWAELAYARAIDNRRNALSESGVTAARAEISAAAERALELDPRAGIAYAALGCLLPWGDYRGRESLFAKALDASPQDPRLLTQMGWLMATMGRNEEALGLATRALALDPLYSRAANMYSQMLAAVGRYDESQRSYALFREKWPLSQAFTSAPLNFASYSGDWEGFDRLHTIAYELGVSGPHIAEALSVGDMIRDPTPQRRERVLQIIRAQIARTGTVEFGPLNMAYRMGLGDEVFSFVEQASFSHLMDETGPPAAAAYSPSIIFDRTSNRAMIEDARFVGFCAKIGLVDYWLRTDHWPDCAAAVSSNYDFKAECRRLSTAQQG